MCQNGIFLDLVPAKRGGGMVLETLMSDPDSVQKAFPQQSEGFLVFLGSRVGGSVAWGVPHHRALVALGRSWCICERTRVEPEPNIKGYALCRRPLEVPVCVKLSAPTDAGAGVQSFFVACRFVLYHGNKTFKMYPIKGSFQVKVRTRGTYGKAEVGRVREEQRTSKKIREEKCHKKENAGAWKGRKVAKHCVFTMICGSRGSKSRLATRHWHYTTLHYTTLVYTQWHYTTPHSTTTTATTTTTTTLQYKTRN